MNRTPVTDWQELSALYERADALDGAALDAWLASLQAESHPLLGQLRQMLAARAKVQSNGFLGTLPHLPERAEPALVEWAAGSRIGPYRLLRHLGAGGMAEVWLAQRDDGAFQRKVAIKLLFRHAASHQRDNFAQRFARERDILASLDHPHIAGLHDAGVTPAGQPWLALEYVEGEPLAAWCDAQRSSVDARVRLFRQVLLAVQHAHANLVIHRDLKPANILVTPKGEVRLLDFGIAKLMEEEGAALVETELTRHAGRPLTVQYASPEQLTGQALTTACDVYSLGVVLYELLCGQRPYALKMESVAQLEQAILDVEPRAPSRRELTAAAAEARGTTVEGLRKRLASDLDAIVLKALAKQPAGRYGSAEAMRADLDRWLGGEAVEARAPSGGYRLRKFVGRHVLSVSLGLGAVAALASVATVAAYMGLQARQESARAVAARDFMMGMFKQADADKSRGADITARELLDRGRDDVMKRLGRQPALQADLLEGIAGIQADMQEFTKADVSFDQLAKLYVSLKQPAMAAKALAARADNALRMGNIELARSLVTDARASLKPGNANAEVIFSLTLTDAWLALRRGDANKAKELFVQCLGLPAEANMALKRSRIEAWTGLVQSETALHDFDSALRAQLSLELEGSSVTGLDPREVVAQQIVHVHILMGAGRYREALTLDQSKEVDCVALLGANDTSCRRLKYNAALLNLRLGRPREVRSELPALEALASDSSSPESQSAASLLLFRGFLMLGEIEQHQLVVARVEGLTEPRVAAPVTPTRRIQAFALLAEMELYRGNIERAEVLLLRAMSNEQASAHLATSAELAATTRTLMGVVSLRRRQPNEALAWFNRSRSACEQTLGTVHALCLLSSLNEAVALEQLGRLDEARARVRLALPLLRQGLGADAPTYERILRLDARLATLASERAVSGTPAVAQSTFRLSGYLDVIEFFI